MTIVYTADLHGNHDHHERLVDYAITLQPKAVIIGGDVAPKGSGSQDPVDPHAFFQEDLPALLAPIRDESPATTVYVMPGNDDAAVHMGVMAKRAKDIYHNLHWRRVPLKGDQELVGYSYVPITPFQLKDWEKWDVADVPPEWQEQYRNHIQQTYNPRGYITTEEGIIPFQFTNTDRYRDTIQYDLQQPLFTDNAANTLYVMHSPPYNTGLDIVKDGSHVGSYAIRQFIEQYQPPLTFHGHIHESVDISGSFRDHIGKTVCLAPGENHLIDELAVIVCDPTQPDQAERRLL